ncbi:MAG: hypothetical protein QM754_18265 [Tepidisphaeraceae bacterium]
MTHVNDYGNPINRDGGRQTRILKASRAAVARQGGREFAGVPETPQWVCPQCGHTNLRRAMVCGGCDEQKRPADAA